MLDLEQQLRALARSLDDQAPPVTADEAREVAASPRRHLDITRLWPLAAAAVVLLVIGIAVAMGGGDDDEGVVTTPGPGQVPLTLDGHREWMLALINDGLADDELADGRIEARFAPEFLASVPPDDVRAIGLQLRTNAPWALSTEVERGDRTLSTQVVGQDGRTARLSLLLDDDQRIAATLILFTRECGEIRPVPLEDLEGEAPLAWAFAQINHEREAPDAELAARLTDEFLAQVPGEEFRRRLSEIHARGPFTPRFYESTPNPDEIVLIVGVATGEEGRLVVETDADGAISILNLTTQQPCALPVD